MHRNQRISRHHSGAPTLVIALALSGFAGCGGDSESALPVASDAGKKDAKRDTALGAGGGPGASGGTMGGLDGPSAVATGGSTGVAGSGGSTGSVDGGRDVGPDLGRGPEVAVGLDAVGLDLGRDAGGGGDTPIDTTGKVDAPVDAPADSVPSQPEVPADASRDVPSDLPILADTRDVPLEGPSPDAPDGPPDTPDGPPDRPDGPPDTPDSPPDTPEVGGPPSSCSNPDWAKSYRVSNAGWMVGDKDGNLLLANTAFANLALGGTAGPITVVGDSQAIVVRLEPAGGSPVWAKAFGDPGPQTAVGVAVDKSGRVGFVGDYRGEMVVGASSLANLGESSYAYVGALQASDGAGLWAISANLKASVSSAAALNAIAANPNFDDFVVCGKANQAATNLNAPGGAPLAAGGGYDIVVAKIKGSDGSILWSRQIGGAGDQTCSAAAVDDSGNVLLAGTYSGTLDFGAGAFSTAPTGANQLLWVSKLSGTDGTTIKAMSPTPGGAGLMSANAYSIATDASGNLVVAGGFRSSLTFGSTTLTSAGLYDAFAVKLDSTLTVAWAKRWGDATHSQYARASAFDSNGHLTVVGSFIGTLEIGPGGQVVTSASDATGSNSDIFLSRLIGSSGESACAVRYGDPAGQEAYNVFIPRWSTSANKDATFVSGLQNQASILEFGSIILDTTNLADPAALWAAKF